MKKLFIVFLLISITAITTYATNLRGYVQKCNQYNECSPSTYSLVQLYYWDGSQWAPGSYTYTGADGYYYFYKIDPGNYYVYVNSKYWYQISIKNMSWQDIAVFKYNF